MFITVAVGISGVSAQQLDPKKAGALADLGYDYDVCAGFFQLASKCIGASDQPLSDIYDQRGDVARSFGTTLGDASGKSRAAMLADTTLIARQLMHDVDGSCLNFSVLTLKYNEQCIRMIEHPVDVAKERLPPQ